MPSRDPYLAKIDPPMLRGRPFESSFNVRTPGLSVSVLDRSVREKSVYISAESPLSRRNRPSCCFRCCLSRGKSSTIYSRQRTQQLGFVSGCWLCSRCGAAGARRPFRPNVPTKMKRCSTAATWVGWDGVLAWRRGGNRASTRKDGGELDWSPFGGDRSGVKRCAMAATWDVGEGVKKTAVRDGRPVSSDTGLLVLRSLRA